MKTPQDYNLPHDIFRPGQPETINWCEGLTGPGIIEAPTGSGKTVYARAVSLQKKTIALCRTKSLQAENYGTTYGFAVLFGRSNYDCVFPDNVGAMADECINGTNMNRCDHSPVKIQEAKERIGTGEERDKDQEISDNIPCPYMVQKDHCRMSRAASLNYAYWMIAGWPRESQPTYLFLDEAHELGKLVIEFAGTIVNEKDREKYDLSHFPESDGKPVNALLAGIKKDPVPVALDWLESSMDILKPQLEALEAKVERAKGSNAELVKQAQVCMKLHSKIKNTHRALMEEPDEWFIRSGRLARKYQGRFEPGFICKPLTARHHFPYYFLGHSQATIMMSATIGDFDEFSKELGIDDYQSRIVPNQFTADQRPIYALDAPAMGARKSSETQAEFDNRFDKQADEIAKAIKECPSDWSGLLLVTRKTEAALLARRLSKRGLGDRVWPMAGHDGVYTPTNQQVEAWNERRAQVPGSLCIAWSLWEGYDGTDEKINIVCKTPYPVFGSDDSYEGQWRRYRMSRYLWTTANTLAQGLGRTRRGRLEDYDTNGNVNGLVAIADSSWSRVKSKLPQDLLDAVRKF